MRINQSEYRLSHSEIQTFKQCRRKWYLRYYLGWKQRDKVKRVARDTGILVHEALHDYYTGRVNDETAFEWLADRRTEDMTMAQAHEVETLTEVYKLAAAVLEGYFDWRSTTGADDQFTITGSEVTLEAPSPVDGVTLFGIIDLIGEHTDGDIVVLDTKVVASIEETVRMLHLNEQALMYALLATVNDGGQRPFRVVWNMLKRSKRTARANPPFYERYELTISPGQLELFYEQLHGVISTMLELEQRLDNGVSPNSLMYPTPTKDCTWSCEFISVCPAMNDPHADPNWLLNSYFVRREGAEQTGATVALVQGNPEGKDLAE
jgi:RecB family exonuclease